MTSLPIDALMRIHNFSGKKMSFPKILLQKIFVAGGSKIRAQDVLSLGQNHDKGGYTIGTTHEVALGCSGCSTPLHFHRILPAKMRCAVR